VRRRGGRCRRRSCPRARRLPHARGRQVTDHRPGGERRLRRQRRRWRRGRRRDGAPAEAAAASLEISGFEFGAATVAPGADVPVDNRDSATHTVTATGGEFESGEVSGGDTGSFAAPDERGTYEFQCEIHPEMAGTLTVR
jgi:plastocyanin